MSTPFHDDPAFIRSAPALPVEELLAGTDARPIRPVDDPAADTFSSDEELDEFLAFNAAERYRDLS